MPPSKLPIVCGLSLALAGCAGQSIPMPLTEAGALAAFKPIANSRRAPCEMQRAVAAHNSAYDTLQVGREVAYKAPCDVDKPAPKTS
jgi:hypothetical protein